MRYPCGGYIINNTIIHWARTKTEFDANFIELSQYGVKPIYLFSRAVPNLTNYQPVNL